MRDLRDTRETETDARDGAALREQAPGAISGRRWSFVAGACLVASLALLVTVSVDAAFVVAVLGALAWFWDQRNRIRANIIEDEHPEEGRDELEEFDEDEEFDDEGGRDEGEPRVNERRGDEVWSRKRRDEN